MDTSCFLMLATTFSFIRSGAEEILCSCDKTNCGTHRECSGDCDLGFYGPGCLASNIAYRKPSIQSSTFGPYTADWAVNGLYLPERLKDFDCMCSITYPSLSQGWWQVILNTTEYFYIQNVTIIGARDSGKLVDVRTYSIYLSNDTKPYPDGNWTLCKFMYAEMDFFKEYICPVKIARAVAIVMGKYYRHHYLKLCEVFVGGYVYRECEKGFGGPGCLQAACDYASCYRYNGICSSLGGCLFSVCPGKNRLPPLCRLALPDYARYEWDVTSTPATISLAGRSSAFPDLVATSCALEVIVPGKSKNYSRSFSTVVTANGSVNIEIEPGGEASYEVRVTPWFCFDEEYCSNEHNPVCYTSPLCFEGGKSRWLKISRDFENLSTPPMGAIIGGAAVALAVVIIVVVCILIRSVLKKRYTLASPALVGDVQSSLNIQLEPEPSQAEKSLSHRQDSGRARINREENRSSRHRRLSGK